MQPLIPLFADGALTHVWVLTEESDLPAITETFGAAYGAPSHVLGENGRVWMPALVAVRYDVPEALFMSGEVAPFFEDWFDSMAS